MPLAESARQERAAWLRLVLTPGVGPATARDLLSAVGLPEEILGASPAALSRVAGSAIAQALLAPSAGRERAVEHALRWAESPHHHLVALIDPAYPRRLLQIGDPPPLLFVRGSMSALQGPSLAIVGSRSGSRAGLETAEAFARALGDAGLTIVSGLALGIDSAAHRGATGSAAGTVAVLGTGVDTLYPPSNAPLADAIVASGGAIVSELPLGTDARRANFPRRNRLIAGMSLGVLVVEAAVRSGSLITARLAGEFGREVLAIPGSIHSPLSKGCHQLIKQGAKLVESAADVLSELPAVAGPAAATYAAPVPPTAPDAETDPLLQAIGWDPVSLEALARTLRAAGPDNARAADPEGAQQAGAMASRLIALELGGLIERLPDGRLQRRPARA